MKRIQAFVFLGIRMCSAFWRGLQVEQISAPGLRPQVALKERKPGSFGTRPVIPLILRVLDTGRALAEMRCRAAPELVSGLWDPARDPSLPLCHNGSPP